MGINYHAKDIKIGSILDTNNSGKCKVIDIFSERSASGEMVKKVKVEFIDTGFIIIKKMSSACKGAIRDKLRKSVCGVACIGYVYNMRSTCVHEYGMWYRMIHRCYNSNDQDYSTYGGAGVRVCERWLRFEYYLQDLPKIQNYNLWLNNPNYYNLDKDILQMGVPSNRKIYSPETCIFIRSDLNSIEAKQRVANDNPNKYLNITTNWCNNYVVKFEQYNSIYYRGIFSDINAAITIRDHIAKRLNRPLIDVETGMSVEEAIKYRCRKNTFRYKQLCIIVDKPQPRRELCKIIDK